MIEIQPIDSIRQQQVIAEVHRYINVASDLYRQHFDPVEVVFNIKGQAAGIYRCYYKKQENTANRIVPVKWSSAKKSCEIRFNPWLFAKYPEDSWRNTIPHEVAHYIADRRYGLKNIKPHGVEWKGIMQDFNAEPIVRGDYSLEGIPVRNTRRYPYQCGCQKISLSAVRHHKIQRGQQEYRCRNCSQIVFFCNNEV